MGQAGKALQLPPPKCRLALMKGVCIAGWPSLSAVFPQPQCQAEPCMLTLRYRCASLGSLACLPPSCTASSSESSLVSEGDSPPGVEPELPDGTEADQLEKKRCLGRATHLSQQTLY